MSRRPILDNLYILLKVHQLPLSRFPDREPIFTHMLGYFCDVNCQSMLLDINAAIGHSSNLKRSQFMYLHILIHVYPEGRL